MSPQAPVLIVVSKVQVGTVIDFLDDHAGALTALLTAVLIGVTVYYAIQTSRTVTEMRRTRELSLLPKLALNFHRLGPTAMTVAVSNVGPGAALKIDVELLFEPPQGADAERRRWRQNILASGEQRDFLPPGELNDSLNGITSTYERICLTGTMLDAAGKDHEVSETFDDLSEWRKVLGEAHERFVEADVERRWAAAFAKKFEALLKQ